MEAVRLRPDYALYTLLARSQLELDPAAALRSAKRHWSLSRRGTKRRGSGNLQSVGWPEGNKGNRDGDAASCEGSGSLKRCQPQNMDTIGNVTASGLPSFHRFGVGHLFPLANRYEILHT